MKIKDFLEKKRFLYPLIILCIALLLSILRINISSVGIYKEYISNSQTIDKNILFGKPRAIRSDYFLVMLPLQISQDINKEPIVNTDIGEGMNTSTQQLPTRNIVSIFKPTLIAFYLSDDTEFSYSLATWLEISFLLIAIYLLLLELTNKNLYISILGSLIFLFTPFIQWWNNLAAITWASFAIYSFIKILQSKKKLELIIFSLFFAYSIVTFSIILYPPFQIPLIYISFAVALGFISKNFRKFKEERRIFKTLLAVISSLLLATLFILLFIKEIKPIIEITMKTTYPGARFITAGLGDVNLLFNGFYNILLQADSNIAHFGNQSESSNFFLFFPPLIIWVLLKNLFSYKKGKNIDFVGVFLSIILLFYLAIYVLPLPSIVSKFTLMYLVPSQRLLIGFGFGSYLLMFYILGNNFYRIENRKIEIPIIVILSSLFAIFIFSIGSSILSTSPDFFKSPTFLKPTMKLILASGFVFVTTLFLLQQKKKSFLIFLTAFAILSSIFINPLYKGLGILINTDLAKYIRKESLADDSKWIIYGNHALAQYALANNANILNGVHVYPQFKIWKIIDPEEKYIDIYNRYAHIMVSETQEENSISLIQQDALMLKISPCDSKLKKLGVKYILTTTPLENTFCLTEKQRFDNDIVIYNLK